MLINELTISSQLHHLTESRSISPRALSSTTINMADQLDMNGLSLHDSQHGPNGASGRSTYIPPHMRGVPQGPPPGIGGGAPPIANGGGLNESMWAGPPRYDNGTSHIAFAKHRTDLTKEWG